MVKFKSREQAGQQLAAHLAKFQSEPLALMAIPNGGIPVAIPVAQTLKCPLSLVPIRSLHIPWAEETIFGYVTHTGEMHLNQALIGQTRISQAEIYQVAKKRRRALQTDLDTWGVAIPESLAGKTTLIVDDGMHSGWTMFSAVETVKHLGARKVMVAVPVTHFRARRFVGHHCDEVVALLTEEIALYEIHNYYEAFPELTSQDVGSLLKTLPQNPRRTAA